MTTELHSYIKKKKEQSDQQNPDISIAEDKHSNSRFCPVPACEGKFFKNNRSFGTHWNFNHEKMIQLRKCLISGKIVDGPVHCHWKLHRLNKELFTKVYIPNDSYIDPGTIVPCFRYKQQLQNMSTNTTSESLVGDGLEVKRELKFDKAGRELDMSGSLNITDRETKEHLPDMEPELAVASSSSVTETKENLPDREPELAVTSSRSVTETTENLVDKEPEPTNTSNVIVRDTKKDLAGRYISKTVYDCLIVFFFFYFKNYITCVFNT